MSAQVIKVIKPVDKPLDVSPRRASIAASDRDFWMQMRHSLLMQLATIEKRLGISRRCKHCGNDR